MLNLSKPIRYYLLISAAFLSVICLALYGTFDKQREENSKLFVIDEHDPLLPKAKALARKNIDTLFQLFPNNEKTYVRFSKKGKQREEHLWGLLTQLETDYVSLIPGEPGTESAEGKELQLPLDAVEDWMVQLPDSSIRGGYTVQLILKRQGEKGDTLAGEQLKFFKDTYF
ncbi:MAG: DUF2314 domain-containing protein [Chitinophagales bacterium]|nr:DUF2314 domain-containing protein [Chitinophagales bacterium]